VLVADVVVWRSLNVKNCYRYLTSDLKNGYKRIAPQNKKQNVRAVRGGEYNIIKLESIGALPLLPLLQNGTWYFRIIPLLDIFTLVTGTIQNGLSS